MKFVVENAPFIAMAIVGVVWGIFCLPTVIKGWAGKLPKE